MKLKKNLGFLYYLLFSFFLTYFTIDCAMTIYPDNLTPGDPIFNNSQVYDVTNERFIYFLGYYTDKTDKYYSKKYGIYYEPVKCEGTSVVYQDLDNLFTNEKIKLKDSTITKNQNFYEEYGLFKNVMTGSNIICPSNLKVVHDINLKITYIIPVIASSATIFTLHVEKSDGGEEEICHVPLEANILKTITVDIKTEVENYLDSEIVMVFHCTDSIINYHLKYRGNRYLKFIFNKNEGPISLSNFRITVEDVSTKTGIKHNQLLDRSRIGLKTSDSCQDSSDCFRGYICVGGFCNPCHYSCIECNQDYSSTTAISSCRKCNSLTIDENEATSNHGICTLNFVDLSQFKDIRVEILPFGNEYNDRATIGMWLFFADLANSRSLVNDIYHIILENRIVLSIVPGDNIFTAYCHAFEDLYRKITSDTTLHSSYYDKSSEYVVSQVIPNDEQFNKMDFETMNGRWFHISCGISLDHEILYLRSVVNGVTQYEEKNKLKHEKLYPGSATIGGDIMNDGFYNHIINNGEYLVLKIKNFGNSNAKIYGKQLMFFKDLIPREMNYMYFDFKDEKDFKEILYQIPFDELIVQPSYKIKGYQYDSGDIVTYDIPLELSHYDISDFKPPLNFYRLLLNEPNFCYTQIDFLKDGTYNAETRQLTSTSSFSNYKYLYDDNKIMNCENNYFYNKNDGTCVINKCNSGFITFPGVSKDTGYCDYECPSSFTCDQTLLNNEDDYDYDNSNFCQNNPSLYNLFFKCVSPSDNYYLQFSGFYNSQTIQFDLPKSLSSYIIEFWFYPDFFLRANARKSQYDYPTYTKNFFFHSNVIDCYFSQTDRLVPYIYDSYKTIKINKLFNSNEWNKFVIYGKYYAETQDYIKTVFVNHAFDQPFSFDPSKKSKATDLETIIFCENKCQDINTENIHWTTGYYKDLRIWDGDMASYSQVVQYNYFYPFQEYGKRVYAILYYFPFSNQYIANNKIVDRDKDRAKYIYFNITRGSYFLKKYNYGKTFDIIGGNGKDKKYSQHASDPPFIDDCDIGCKRCWERTLCYECIDDYYLSGRKCLKITNYYYRNPNKEGDEITLNYDTDYDGVTISFWTKPIGFQEQKQTMITLGNTNPLILGYSSLREIIYGLYLEGNDDDSSVDFINKIIGYESEFRDNIGKWTFISIAYHKQIGDYFPRMIKFEINTKSIEANPAKIKMDPSLRAITIDRGYFGLFVGIKYYTEYIIQAITYEEINQPNLNSPFRYPGLLRPTNNGASASEMGLACNGKTFRAHACVPDEKPDIGLFLDTCDLYKDTLTTEDSCLNTCSGRGWTRCNCMALNHNSQMIFNNTNKNLCRPLEYINFAKIKRKTINNITSSDNEHKCTLQFWMFAYSYNKNKFGGITFTWARHNEINVKLEGDKYYFYCTSKAVDIPSVSVKEEIEINQWIFLSCAVDYKVNMKIYLNINTQDDKISLKNDTVQPTRISSDPSSLTISDDTVTDEWGILFFRQIRLWKDAYFNAGFLSRIFIETPSKFYQLLHSWEPSYKGIIGGDYEENNLYITDIFTLEKTKIEYQTNYQSTYGMNVIDETKYSILTMCSEDGLYFDVTLKKCLQFIDLSKMQDFTFKELPSAYSGSYAMAFWVFFEECEKYSGDKGLHLQWFRHLQITVRKDIDLDGHCFPQGYYSDYEDNDNFDDKFGKISLNKVKIPLVDEGTSEDGVWIWVICSISYYERFFYLKGNRQNPAVETITSELIEKNANATNVTTSYPMRFYLSDLNNNVMHKSKLSIINIDHERKMYLREILLFRNHIPDWYADRFKYMNMKMLSDNQLPALLFVANFADFNLETRNLKYIIFERKYGSLNYERIDTSMYLSLHEIGSTFELSANFKFQPLCDLSTQDYKKYDIATETCIDIRDCILRDIHATYCMEENMPLSCESGYMFTLNHTNTPDNTDKVLCTNKCIKEEFITPGTPKDRGICNTVCPVESKPKTTDHECQTTVRLMECDDGYDIIGYKCIESQKSDSSALFFSKCYNSPNFYRTISTNTLAQISSGYFYEFWMKMDNDLIDPKTCYEAGSADKEYYLYSTPHSIYKDNTEDAYYYQIINTAYKRKLTGISTTFWNKIVIETIIATTGQHVYVHTNFEKDIAEIKSISAGTTMRLQYISFCSRKTSGDCIPGSSNIMWGSAYYQNIRVWDIRSSSIQTIQDYNNGVYSEKPKSLILFYPLTIKYMDRNVITEIISGIDNIVVEHQYSNNFQSEDNVINYNYETNLDWHLKHECIKPYTDPKDKELLVKDDCIKVTGYFLKVPANTEVQLKILDTIEKLQEEAYTFCIYMKFIGVMRTSTSAQPKILIFKDDTFIVYDIATSYLIFYIGGSEIEAFRDTNFHAYIGIWTPICIANLRSKNPYIHPHMITLSVNKIDIPFSSGYSIAKDGLHLSRIALGNEIIAYFADFRLYSRFIQGNFGTIMSAERKGDDLILHYPLNCTDDQDNRCVMNATFTDSSMHPCCVGDYNVYQNYSLWCNETFEPVGEKYFDINLPNNKYCDNCQDYCKTLCYNSEISECTCDMRETVYWLRKNKANSKTYCEHPPYIDYSLLNDINITVPSSTTNESTIEFWVFIYSYNTTNVNFKEINFIWNRHNRIQIINEKNSLSAKCYALWDVDDPGRHGDLVQTLSVTAFGWISLRCGSDINRPTFRYFFNTYEKTFNIDSLKPEFLPYDRCDSPTNLYFINGANPKSYGFLFIRELKLWQQYNVVYIDTSYINLNLELVDKYDPSRGRSKGQYPGLITLIRSEFDIEEYEDAIDGIYHIKNLLIEEEDAGTYTLNYTLTRNNENYIGYNLVDPTNAGYYKNLVLCDEGWVYNSLYGYCEQPSFTKCLYPGDTKDTCIMCKNTEIFLHPVDGLCKTECPTGYYARPDMNQCRPCNETCYKCDWMFGTNCTECIGDRYLYLDEKMCVLKCEEYNLTASNITNNLCTGFDADAIIINYDLEKPIDINTFEKLVGKVINYTSRDYTVEWSFEPQMTRDANPNLTMGFTDDMSPFIGDLTKEEEVKVDKNFFELARKYVVTLTVIAHNILYYDSIVYVPIHFTLIMNSYPVNGTLTIFPKTGLYRTTYFVIKCEGWEDDTSDTSKLQYQFYALEENTASVIKLRGWSLESEIATNFSVIYYQQEKSLINIYCDIKDELNATWTTQNNITIAKSLTGGIYKLNDSLPNFTTFMLNEYEDAKPEREVLLYHRSQFLLSLTIDAYKTVYPNFLQTQFESALDGTEVLMEDPTCVAEYCNDNGNCVLVDEFLICHCNEGWTGKYCHIDRIGQDTLEFYFNQLFLKVYKDLEDTISWYQFMSIYNLFKGASLFFDDTQFFTDSLEVFLTRIFPDSIANNTKEYLEMLDFYYSYQMMRMEKLKTDIQYSTGNFGRDISLDEAHVEEFGDIFEHLNTFLLDFMRVLANQNAITRRTFIFTSENYYQGIIPVNPSFDDQKFFEGRKSVYKTHIDFMNCLNYIEMDKLANPYYQGYFLYIDYNFFPFGYNHSLLINNTSPMIEMRFVDSTTGKYISITGCENDNKIVFHMPFTSYRYLEEFNYQKLFYDPNIYKGPDDPIFSDPIYIEETGVVSDDTIEQRIAKYSRKYNITPMYYDELYWNFSYDGIAYINFTNDVNFIEYSSSHLCRFTTFIVQNNATYHPNGRFFYLARPRVLKHLPNYYQSFGSLIFLGCFIFYLIYMIICLCYDQQYTSQEELLDYIKKEIVKNFYPYAKNKDVIVEKLIPTQMNVDFKPEIKFGIKGKQTITERMGLTTNGEDLNEKIEKLGLKDNRNTLFGDDEDDKDKVTTTHRRNDKRKDRKKMNAFLKEKPELKKKNDEDKKKKNNNIDDYASEIENEIGNVNRATFSINYLPKNFEKSKEENERRINNFGNLKLTSGQFFSANYKLRTTLINSFCNVSLFQPRWKKMTMLITEIGLMILVISILLTLDESARIAEPIKIGYLFAYGLSASTFSNMVMYLVALFFHFPQDLARRLYKLVLFNGQLIVLREWEEITHAQGLKSIPGVIICIILWAVSLYVGLGFTAVWHDQGFEFLISFGFAFILNFFVMELIVEGIIAIFYIGRKRFNCVRRFTFSLNRLRNYRCLSA